MNSIQAQPNVSLDDIQSCNVFHQDINTLDEPSKKYGDSCDCYDRAFASKYHISRIVYPNHVIAYLPEPINVQPELDTHYRPSYYYREQRSMLHVTSSILDSQSLPIVLTDGSYMIGS